MTKPRHLRTRSKRLSYAMKLAVETRDQNGWKQEKDYMVSAMVRARLLFPEAK